MNRKELEIKFTNYSLDEMAMELSDRIKDGFHIESVMVNHSYLQSEVTVKLLETHRPIRKGV